MGVCQSVPDVTWAEKPPNINFDALDQPCPTVFELERAITQRRLANTRVHVNLVNIDFRRGIFEVYAKGEDLSPVACTGVHAEDEIRMFVGTHKETGLSYAIREVSLPSSRSALEVEEMWKVLDAWTALDHPNLCRLQEIFCSEERYYIVSDLCSGGDIMSRLVDEGRDSYEEPEAIDIVRKIVGALRYCHSESVAHGNLRIESCLFEDFGPWADVRIVDPCARPHSFAGRSLGASGTGSLKSTVFGSDASRSSNGRRMRKATGWYMPPEVRGSSGGTCTEEGDMWTLGALTWQVLAGLFPQRGITQEAAWSSIIVGRPIFKGEGWAGRSLEAADFVSCLLNKDPSKRMTAAEALKHPWLSSPSPLQYELFSNIRSSLHAFKESSVIRRLGLVLVGRTHEPARLLSAKSAFRAVDTDGKGYIVEADLVKVLEEEPSFSYRSKLDSSTRNVDFKAKVTSPSSSSKVASSDKASIEAARLAHELFQTIDLEGLGAVSFSAFLGACLAQQPADEPGIRMAFGWLAKSKDVITTSDLGLLAGKVMTQQELEGAFVEGRNALDNMTMTPADIHSRTAVCTFSTTREATAVEFTYTEFYRLLAGVFPPASAPTYAATPGLILIALGSPSPPAAENVIAITATANEATASIESDDYLDSK